VVDFGIARFLDAAQRRTADGVVLGTAIYISPEQCHGSTEVDGRADVYSLGIMLYEMIAGKPPFEGEATTMMLAHMSHVPPPLRKLIPSLPRSVCELVDDMLVKAPEKRLTMKDVVARIKKIEGTTKDLLAPVFAQTLHQGDGAPVLAQKPGSVSRLAILAGAVGLALGLALVLSWTALSSRRMKEPPGAGAITPQKVVKEVGPVSPPPAAPVAPRPPEPVPVATPPVTPRDGEETEGERRRHHSHRHRKDLPAG
jgi:serine/threonine protein kinase